jgi:transcriptional regulator with XRE-family HTH domain
VYNRAVVTSESRQLASFISQWLEGHRSSALKLAQRGGIPHTTLSALFNHGNIPRPVTLKKLATAMGVPLSELLVRAGHLSREDLETPIRPTDLARLYEFGDLSEAELDEVKEFARFVRSKRTS